MFIKPVSKILILLWLILALCALCGHFSLWIFALLCLLSFIARHPLREAGAPGKFLSPADARVLKIFADEERRELCVLLKTTPCSSPIITAPADAASLGVNTHASAKLAEFASSGCSELSFDGGVRVQIYPRRFGFYLRKNYYDIARANCVGYVFSAYVLVILPYETRLEIGLDDFIKAGQTLARIE